MKLYWLCNSAQKNNEFRVAKNIDDLYQKKSKEINKEFNWVKDNYECGEIYEIDGYRVILEKINRPVDRLEDKVWIEEIQETFK